MEAKTLMIRLTMACLFALLGLALWADLSVATTYWVSPGGAATLCTDIDGDTDPGAYMTLSAIDTNNCATAGDTVMWKAGTYTGARVLLTSVLPSGTSASVISTHLCETDRGCIVAFSSVSNGTAVMQTLNAQYYRIGRQGNGFIADCVNGGDGCGGVYLQLSGSIIATGVIVENILVRNHHATAFNMSEQQPTNYYDGVTWRYNENEESASPAYTGGGTPHGMYIKGHNVVVEYNRFRSITVSTANSYVVHGYHNVRHARVRFNDLIAVGSLARGITLNDDETTPADTDNWAHSNTIRCPATDCALAISFGPSNRANGTRAYNNTVYGFSQFLIVSAGNNNSHFVNNACTGGSCAITNSGTNLTCGGTCSTTNPTVTAASNFVDAANGDFSLISTSTLVNAGIDVGLPYSGSAPDQGAHESFTQVSAAISTDLIAVTFDPTLSVLVADSTAGWSASCSGTNCPGGGSLTIDTVTRSGNTIANVQVSGFTGGTCEAGQTITISFNAATGTLTDSALIGGTTNQEVFSFTSYPVTNECTGTPPPTVISSPYKYELDGNANDTGSLAGASGTLSGGAAFSAGLFETALQGVSSTAVSMTSTYGSGVNPSTQSFTVAWFYRVPDGAANTTATIMGTGLGTNQRFFVSAIGGTWQIGIQSSSVSAGTPSTKAVQEKWVRLCLNMDSGTDTATLYVDGEAGPSKSYTSYTLANNIAVGLPSGFGTVNAGAGLWDRVQIWTAVQDCADDYAANVQGPTPSAGMFSQVAWKARSIFESTLSGGSSSRDVVKGGAVGLSMQVDCTLAACTPTAFIPWYSKNGGSYQILPSTPTADGISYYGVVSGVYLGSTARWSGALTDAGSQVQRIGTDAAVVSLSQNSSYVVTVLIKLDPVLAVNGDTFSVKLRDQNGAEFTGTIVPSQITVISMQAGVR